MKKKLEVIVLPKPHNRKEFKQSLNFLTEGLQNYCSSLKTNESEDGLTFTILARWDTTDQMRKALRSEEFLILSGAITALCEKISIRLNDKTVGDHVSKLKSL